MLRKKNDHISTLHVIHHGIMPMSVWFGVKFTPGGHSTFFGFLNTFVHIIMYAYYLLAALGPQYQKYLWWKKYLTTIQMVWSKLVFSELFWLKAFFFADSVRFSNGSCFPITFHRLQLSQSFRLVDWNACRYVLLLVLRLLQTSLQEKRTKESKNWGKPKWHTHMNM